MVYTATTFKYAFDYKPSDVYWYAKICTNSFNGTLVCESQW